MKNEHLYTMTVHFITETGGREVRAYLATETKYAIKQAKNENGKIRVLRVEITN